MKIQAPCAVCINENPAIFMIGSGVVNDSGLVHVTCPKGHKSAIVFKERKYMLLLKSGCRALIDSHVRESVSSISSALERCYEFFIRSALHKYKLDGSATEKTWKLMAKQSERQFGAFSILYALEAGKPFVLPPEIPTFRNRVIHEGYIPTTEEALSFGRAVMVVIRDIEHILDKLGSEHTESVQAESLAIQVREIPSGLEYATLLGVTGVKLDSSNTVIGVVETFDELMELQKKGWGSSPKGN
jgi:hypothetical protein